MLSGASAPWCRVRSVQGLGTIADNRAMRGEKGNAPRAESFRRRCVNQVEAYCVGLSVLDTMFIALNIGAYDCGSISH